MHAVVTGSSGFVGKHLDVVHLDHGRAGARRNHDVVIPLKLTDQLAGQIRGVIACAGIECRLTAAGLIERHLDIATGIFEQLERGKTDLRTRQIDKAGGEQTYARVGWVLVHRDIPFGIVFPQSGPLADLAREQLSAR